MQSFSPDNTEYTTVTKPINRVIKHSDLYAFMQYLLSYNLEKGFRNNFTEIVPSRNINRDAFYCSLDLDKATPIYQDSRILHERHYSIDSIYASAKSTKFKKYTISHYTEVYLDKNNNTKTIVHAYFDEQTNLIDIDAWSTSSGCKDKQYIKITESQNTLFMQNVIDVMELQKKLYSIKDKYLSEITEKIVNIDKSFAKIYSCWQQGAQVDLSQLKKYCDEYIFQIELKNKFLHQQVDCSQIYIMQIYQEICSHKEKQLSSLPDTVSIDDTDPQDMAIITEKSKAKESKLAVLINKQLQIIQNKYQKFLTLQEQIEKEAIPTSELLNEYDRLLLECQTAILAIPATSNTKIQLKIRELQKNIFNKDNSLFNKAMNFLELGALDKIKLLFPVVKTQFSILDYYHYISTIFNKIINKQFKSDAESDNYMEILKYLHDNDTEKYISAMEIFAISEVEPNSKRQINSLYHIILNNNHQWFNFFILHGYPIVKSKGVIFQTTTLTLLNLVLYCTTEKNKECLKCLMQYAEDNSISLFKTAGIALEFNHTKCNSHDDILAIGNKINNQYQKINGAPLPNKDLFCETDIRLFTNIFRDSQVKFTPENIEAMDDLSLLMGIVDLVEELDVNQALMPTRKQKNPTYFPLNSSLEELFYKALSRLDDQDIPTSIDDNWFTIFITTNSEISSRELIFNQCSQAFMQRIEENPNKLEIIYQQLAYIAEKYRNMQSRKCIIWLYMLQRNKEFDHIVCKRLLEQYNELAMNEADKNKKLRALSLCNEAKYIVDNSEPCLADKLRKLSTYTRLCNRGKLLQQQSDMASQSGQSLQFAYAPAGEETLTDKARLVTGLPAGNRAIKSILRKKLRRATP